MDIDAILRQLKAAGAFDREHYGLRETAIWQAEAWPATEVDEAFEVEGESMQSCRDVVKLGGMKWTVKLVEESRTRKLVEQESRHDRAWATLISRRLRRD